MEPYILKCLTKIIPVLDIRDKLDKLQQTIFKTEMVLSRKCFNHNSLDVILNLRISSAVKSKLFCNVGSYTRSFKNLFFNAVINTDVSKSIRLSPSDG